MKTTSIINNKNIPTNQSEYHIYLDYLVSIYKQYLNSMGSDIPKTHLLREISNMYKLIELEEYINETKMKRELFNEVLKHMGIKGYTENLIEVNKGNLDSLITTNKDIYIDSKFLPLFKSLSDLEFKTADKITNKKPNYYIAHNPFSLDELQYLKTIHENKGNIVLGVYGSVYDKDMKEKLALINKFKNEITNTKVENAIINDTYVRVLTSKKNY